MNKSIQQILDEERKKSRLSEVSDATINRALANDWKRDDAEFSKTMSSVANERNKDQQYVESHLNGVRHNRDNSYQAESNARVDVREKISKKMKAHQKTEEHLAKVAESNKAKHQDPEYRKKYEAGLAKRDRKFHAGEYGIFDSRSKAIEYAKSKGLSNAQSKIERWTKENPTEYYYIEKEKE